MYHGQTSDLYNECFGESDAYDEKGLKVYNKKANDFLDELVKE